LFFHVSVNHVLNFPEHHFHKNGLRANPTTKNTAEYHCKKYYENNKRKHGNHKQEEILRPENHAEENKFSLEKVEEKQWLFMKFNPGQCKKDNEVNDAYSSTGIVQLSMRQLGKNPVSLTGFSNSTNRISESVILYAHYLLVCIAVDYLEADAVESETALAELSTVAATPPSWYNTPSGALALAGLVPCSDLM
jgi:hypothetical protein